MPLQIDYEAFLATSANGVGGHRSGGRTVTFIRADGVSERRRSATLAFAIMMQSLRTSSAIMLALMLSVAFPACSSSGSGDTDGGKMTSTGSTGGSTGTGGSATGGSTGTGGADTGGSGGATGRGGGGGEAGGGHAGGGGQGGSAGGQPGGGGRAGSTGGHAGGAGGHAGSAGGHAGSAGGHGGGGADPLDQACTSACAMQAGLSCQDATCHDDCVAGASAGTGQSCKSQYTALLECEAKVPASGWICSSDEDVPEVANGQCMTTLCAWACCVSSLITTSDVWSRCLPVCG